MSLLSPFARWLPRCAALIVLSAALLTAAAAPARAEWVAAWAAAAL